ncbi:transcription factor [Colletotrichum musicola]|uniref:Transcription factor n=1 Tax=Colletotrichum musicola TaxID=2175873 RepID=A0A8H6J403_9PEZI|nr:transcription factor [Colletotrichum musicola]
MPFSFIIGDVCRKHTIHCPNKSHHEALPNLKRGQKPRACDACFHSKQSCDNSDPCERCVLRKLSCTYRRLEEGPLLAAQDPSASNTANGSGTATNNNDKDRTKLTIAFLLGLTNPDSENILEFLAGEAASRIDTEGLDPATSAASMQFPPGMSSDQDFAAFLTYGISSLAPEAVDNLFSMSLGHGGLTTNTSNMSSTPTSPFNPIVFGPHSAALLCELHSLHDSLVASNPSYSGSFNLDAATSAFSADSLCTFAATYFRVSHLDFPILHKPYFGTARTTKPLLLAVGMAGAIRSAPSDDALAARGFLSLSEEYIFRRLRDLFPAGSTPEYTPELEEALQAAVMIHSVQFFRNDTATRRKNRTQRLPMLVSAVRLLGLAQTRHAPVFDFDEFVRNESRIRLVTWLALADWQQSGMSNVPCLITPSEMTCDLPCPLELFDARDADDYREMSHSQGIDTARRVVSVKQCMDALISDSWNGMGVFPFQAVNGVDLQIMIFGINSMVISSNLMGLLPTTQRSLMRALSRWELMWEAIKGRMDPETFRKSGMVRYNTELCWAAKKIIKVAIVGDRSSAYMQKVGHDSLVELHEFVRQYRDI